MNGEQNNTDYVSRGWQLHKLQRVKMRESKQCDKLLKEIYSWVNNKRTRITANEKWRPKLVIEILGLVYKSLSHSEHIVSKTTNRT